MRGSARGAVAIVVTVVAFAAPIAQTRNEKTVVKLDPALDAIVSPDAKLEQLGECFGITEGPVWISEPRGGYLLFSDIAANVVYKWTPGGQTSVFLEKSGFTGADNTNVGAQSTSGRLPVIALGSNGLTLDPEGRLVIATHGDRNVVRLEKDGTRTVLADRYDGKRFSGPNDLVIKSNGALYFTDAIFGLRGREKSPDRELPFHGVYLVKDGRVVLLDKDPQGGMPNGIALTPDEQRLYVGSARKIIRYDIQPDDTITNGVVLIEATTDGMKVDSKGNLYLTDSSGVTVVSADGRRLGVIQPPKLIGNSASSVAFGDADGKTLYVTARTHLYRIRLKVSGPRPGVPAQAGRSPLDPALGRSDVMRNSCALG
jgi:gluconolactonase